MFKAIKEFFVGKPVEVTPAVPYKVEAEPVATPVTTAEAVVVVPEAVVPASVVEAVVVAEAPAKKPRKPRAPKAEVVSKPAAKKAVPAKKAAVKKPAARSVVRSKKA